MQTSPAHRSLTMILLLGVTLTNCFKRSEESAEKAIGRSRGTLIDQVNAAGEGAPFFSVQTLNPIWRADGDTPIVRIPSLKLTDQHGRSVTETLFDGKISVVAFMFTSCNGFCPFVMQKLKKASAELQARSDVQYIAITVDPEIDTPERLADFAKSQDLDSIKSLVLLTGEQETIYSFARDTLASQVFRKPGDGPRNFVHAGHFYIFDPEGRLRGILNGTEIDSPIATAKFVNKL